MHAQSLRYRHPVSPLSPATHRQPSPVTDVGTVGELVYNVQQNMLPLLLGPLLRQLDQQPRWQLWLNPPHKLNKSWLLRAGFPTDKAMQFGRNLPETSLDTMVKALRSGNYSIVLGWLPSLTDKERARLNEAANAGQCIGLILRQDISHYSSERAQGGSEIHPKLYH